MPQANGLPENFETIRSLQYEANTLKTGQLYESARLCLLQTDRHPGPEDAAAYFRTITGNPEDLRLCEQFAAFCRMLAEGIAEKDRLLAALMRDTSPGESPPLRSTALMKSPPAELAFTRFSSHENGLTASYQSSFSAACEEVYYGRCGYCILPQWSSEEGTYALFHRMLTKYDLKICSGCSVQNQDSTVRFALLRRGLSVLPLSGGDKEIRIQLSVVLAPDQEIRSFLSCTEALETHLEYLNLFPLAYSEDRFSVCITLKLSSTRLIALLFFLEASESRYTVDGIYEVIQSQL